MNKTSAELSYSIPLGGSVRGLVLEQLLTSLPFQLQQTPFPLSELRRWYTGLKAAETVCSNASGGRPPPPRGILRRRAIKYLERMETLLEGVRVASSQTVVHSALIVLGPTTFAPRLVFHVAFSPLDGNPDVPPPPIRTHVALLSSSGEEGEGSGGGVCVASPTPHPIPDWYNECLSKDTSGAVTRKVARVLLTEGPTLFGTSGFSSLAPMHVLLHASPRLSCTGGESVGEGVSGVGEEISDIPAPPGWIPRHLFSLKPQRTNSSKRARSRYSLAHLRVIAAGGEGVQGSVGAIGVLKGGSGGMSRASTMGEALWYQWGSPPKGFKGALPSHPLAKKKRVQ